MVMREVRDINTDETVIIYYNEDLKFDPHLNKAESQEHFAPRTCAGNQLRLISTELVTHTWALGKLIEA